MEQGGYREGQLRETMAAYFVRVPAFETQTPWQKRRTKRMLRVLWRTETDSVLRYAGQSRGMRQGDVPKLLTAVLRSAVILTGREHSNLSVITPLYLPRVIATMEPRILQLGLIALLKDNVHRGHMTAELTVMPRALQVRVQSERALVCSDRTLKLLKEIARLHSGSLAIEKQGIILEISTQQRGGALFAVPDVTELTHVLTAIPVMGLIKFCR